MTTFKTKSGQLYQEIYKHVDGTTISRFLSEPKNKILVHDKNGKAVFAEVFTSMDRLSGAYDKASEENTIDVKLHQMYKLDIEYLDGEEFVYGGDFNTPLECVKITPDITWFYQNNKYVFYAVNGNNGKILLSDEQRTKVYTYDFNNTIGYIQSITEL